MYKEKKFNIGKLKGISEKNIEEHLKLYSGYVKHTNLILEKLNSLSEDYAYEKMELQRRFAFEFDGMKNHEIYFESLSENANTLQENSILHKAISGEWGSFDKWLTEFKIVAKTRGVGWAILYYDKTEKKLLNAWVDEQHLGHLNGCVPILCLDMWEHSFVADYQPSGKGQYIDDFFENLNWQVIDKNFENANS